MITLDQHAIETLALRFFPVLRFHEEERFFPLLAEAWLTTGTNGVWPDDADRTVRLWSRPDDPHRRGGAMCTADAMMTALSILTGPPVSSDRPIALDEDSADPYSILSDVITRAGGSAFLDVGGWTGSGDRPFSAGDIDFLASLCSELGSAVNPTVTWTPLDVAGGVIPWQWIAQPTNPTMYCEVTWGGAWPRRAQRTGAPEFPAGEHGLDQVIAFTYNVLYGAREPGGDGRNSEGQWEAVTLFFRAEVGRSEGNRPEGADTEFLRRGGSIDEQPFAVVVSQGQDRSTDTHITDIRRYDQCEHLGVRPVIYVTKGSHRNLFAPVTGETFDPGAHGPHAPDTTGHDDEPGSWVGVDGFLIISGLLVALAAVLLVLLASVVGWVAAIVVAVIIIILALILFIMWIVSACDESSDEDAGDHVDNGGEPNEAGSTGPQSGGDGSEDPAPAGPGSSGGSTGGSGGGPSGGTVGLPNTGSPTGSETTFPDVRIIERVFVDGARESHTPFPASSMMENPTWWDYQGRWGVRVEPAPAAGTWESGWKRVDELERDWGYFTGERLLIALNLGTI